jgi:mediator of RNA polymerase II transcription subunit 13
LQKTSSKDKELLFTESHASIAAITAHGSSSVTQYNPSDIGCLDVLIADNDEIPACDALPTRSITTSTLLRAPSDGGLAATTMLHVHLLHTIKSDKSSLTLTDVETHQDLTRNFHELAQLSSSRWNLSSGNPLLPLHLAAVETMSNTLASLRSTL